MIANAVLNNPQAMTSEEKKAREDLITTLVAGAAAAAGGGAGSAVAGVQVEQENNAFGGAAGSDLGFWFGKTPDCDTACKTEIAAGVAKGNLITAGGVTIVAASAEVAVAVRAALVACKVAPLICINEAGIITGEALVPGGIGTGGAIGAGKTVAEAAAAKAEAVAANAAKNILSDIGKINAGKFGLLELKSLSKTGANIDPAAKSGNFTIAGRALQKHGSRGGSVYPVAKGTPAQINEQGQKVLDGIVKAPGASVKEGNRFGGFDIISPDGRGARFDPQGNFRGFLEP